MRFSPGVLLSFSWLAQAAVVPNEARSTDLQTSAGSGLKSMTFYVDWAIYDREYMPDDLIPQHFTHVLYAFLDIKPSGEVVLADPWADVNKHFPGDSWTDPGNNVYGCVKQLYEIKQKNRHMNTILSIGGWTYRHKFAGPASTAAGRKTFATSAVNHLKNLGFDGIDVDWEYPANDAQASDLVELLKEIRSELDSYQAEVGDGKKYLLTVDSSAGPQHYNYYHFKDMDKYIDFWNLMAFDYAGGTFSNETGYLANVYKSDTNPDATPFATDPAIKDYIAAGVPPEKIVLGMPLYGRSFANTQGMGKPFDGAGDGTWEDGNWDYSELPHPGATVHSDFDIIGSYGYDGSKDLLISFDTPEIQAKKADYITSNSLGGGWWWESSSDKTGQDSLVRTVIDQWGGTGAFEQRENQLNYPLSKYDNIKNRMGNGNPPSSSSASSSTSPTSSTSSTTSTKTQPSSTPTGETVPHWGQCGGNGYDGPTTCTPPYTCVKQSEWWSSCQ